MDGTKAKQAIKQKSSRAVHDPDDVLREQTNRFIDFLREYAVVGLAIGFILGQEANAVVRQFVASFVQPWLQVMLGGNIATYKATFHRGAVPVDVPWGAFVYVFIEFLFVAVIIYMVFRMLRLDKLKQPNEKEEEKK